MRAWQHARNQPPFFWLQQGHGQGRRFSTRHILAGGGEDTYRGFLIGMQTDMEPRLISSESGSSVVELLMCGRELKIAVLAESVAIERAAPDLYIVPWMGNHAV